MTGGHTIFTSVVHRERALARIAAVNAHHLRPVIETLKSGVALLFMMPGKIQFTEPPRGRAWIACIGDDLIFAEGPSAFHLRSLRRLLARANAVYVMAGAAVPEACQAAADVAEAGHNCIIIIETQTSEEASWLDFACRHAPRAAKSFVTPNARKWRNAA